MKKLFLTIAILGLLSSTTYAQYDDYDDVYNDDYDDTYSDDSGYDDSYDYDENGGGTVGDSTATDDYGYDDGYDSGYDDYGDGGSYDDGYVRSARPKFEHKAYERFTGMPYDSATELVTYVEVVEVLVRMDYLGEPYDYADSLHARALKWMGVQFGEKEAKRMIEESGPDTKNREGLTIKSTGKVPLVVEKNEFTKINAGDIQFDMELRFKDGRYRYKFNNFVHVEYDQREGKDPITTYIEYYMDAKKNIKENDAILIATNNKMNAMITDLKETCAHEPFIDDDDW